VNFPISVKRGLNKVGPDYLVCCRAKLYYLNTPLMPSPSVLDGSPEQGKKWQHLLFVSIYGRGNFGAPPKPNVFILFDLS